MPYLLFGLLLAYPFAEVMSLIWLADAIGTAWTVVWMVASFACGVLMLRHSRLAVGLKLMNDMRSGQVGVNSLFGIARYFVAAILLIIPGLISDVIALVLLLPWKSKSNLGQTKVDDGIIDAEYRRVDPIDETPRIER
ncbi:MULTISPECIES: FxsA family protein [Deefgea]|uniref:Membrane protein FxsA n=1 Tax=Deefgea chitinilytica TaxID=570276 RepID=A0ABS2CEJ1_9NEIS|nr:MULTISPECIES: FxsA family protein [Deefgea]MBM5572569.1 membrane protein FxsA [Deefgea chitinilytica]MBM9889805.1 FxsA family protein [Deefgea sp. CFH1-16]